jgi:choline dehydrogenase-like flavoprotein
MIERYQKNKSPGVLPNINSKFLGLYFQSEHTPNYNSRITIEKNKKDHLGLPKVKVKIKFNEIDKKSVVKAHEFFIKRFIETKAGNLQKKNSKKEIEHLIKQDIKSFDSIAHNLGTTRMSKSHTSGVVDKNCKVFGLKNLFIAGSSVFSTAGHANPTFTIVALSLKLSRFLKKINKKK